MLRSCLQSHVRHYFGRLLTSTSAQSHEYNSVSQGQYTAISLYSKISRQEGSWQKFSSTSNKDEDEPQSAPSGKKESATVGTEGGILGERSGPSKAATSSDEQIEADKLEEEVVSDKDAKKDTETAPWAS